MADIALLEHGKLGSGLDESDFNEVHTRGPSRKKAARKGTSAMHLLLAGLLGSILTLFIHFVASHYKEPQYREQAGINGSPPLMTTCGDSSESAISRKCFFDPVSFSWLPPQCHDTLVTAELPKAQLDLV